jgi:uncharacterized protein (DUF305 family)
MAKKALAQAEHPELTQLANDIIAAQVAALLTPERRMEYNEYQGYTSSSGQSHAHEMNL